MTESSEGSPAAPDEELRRVVRSPDEVEYLVRVQRAPRPGLFISTPWRWLALITRDRSWWLTVDSSRSTLPVVRERYGQLSVARERFEQLVEGLASGALQVPSRIAWGRGPVRRSLPFSTA